MIIGKLKWKLLVALGCAMILGMLLSISSTRYVNRGDVEWFTSLRKASGQHALFPARLPPCNVTKTDSTLPYIKTEDVTRDIKSHTQPFTFWHANLSEMEKKNLPKRKYKTVNDTLFQLKNFSVIICGCCRTVRKHLPKIRKHIGRFASLFKSYKILFGESDSVDDTVAYLKSWSLQDQNVVVQTYGTLEKVFSRRTVRLAYCRGSLLSYARVQLGLEHFQFYMVLDVDAINDNDILSLETFLTNFDYPLDSWGVMTASQTKRYYDTWTIRSPAMNYDYLQIVFDEKRKGNNFNIALQRFMKIHWPPIPVDHDLIEVYSAFGGFAVYQTKYLQDCSYIGYDIENDAINYEICDHVLFNLCVNRNGGRIFINPRFQNSNGLVN